MSICPYCKSEMQAPPVFLSLSPRQRIIYDTVAAGGVRGANIEKLLKAVYVDKPPKAAWGVLRVYIFEINRKIMKEGQRIRGRRGVGYVLVTDKSLMED